MKIKQLRIKSGITQKKVADYLGICVRAYQKKEYGITEFKKSELEKLCALYYLSSLDELR